MRKKVEQDYIDETFYQQSNVNELPYIRTFYISKSLQVVDATGLAFTEIKGFNEKLKSVIDKETELQVFQLYLELVSSVGITIDAIAEIVSYYYYLEDEPDDVLSSFTEKKMELLKANPEALFFFIKNAVSVYPIYSIVLLKFTVAIPKAQVLRKSKAYNRLFN